MSMSLDGSVSATHDNAENRLARAARYYTNGLTMTTQQQRQVFMNEIMTMEVRSYSRASIVIDNYRIHFAKPVLALLAVSFTRL
jgi:hypothetical protein